MPKSRSHGSSITYSCDICDFKVTNSYIFKRHLHRCYTLHGVASKRSSPRQPLRMKGTEGVRSVRSVGPGGAEDWQTGGGDQVGGENGDDNVVDDDNGSAVLEGVSQGEENDALSPSPMSSSQWSVKDSPGMAQDVIGQENEEEEDGVDDDEEDDDDEESRIVSLNGENENDDTMDSGMTGGGGYVEDERSLTESPSLSVMRAKFERNYLCEHCPFKTIKSKEYLLHLRDVHGERLNVFECPICDYASRYNNKLMRHMAVHKKTDPSGGGVVGHGQAGIGNHSLDLGDDNGGDGQSVDINNQELKVKPLKLKRLHVKTPSLFQVSHNECQMKREKDLPNSSPSGRNVFKMVLAADGSHDYQCRDCLFYANTAMAVKKHYSLCHSKVLQCSQCDFATRSQAEHYEHIITHNQRITYHKCPECSYVTHAKPTFENHRSHHGSNAPFKCRVCNFAADSESKVKRHMATQHTNRHNDTDEIEVAPQEMDTSDTRSGWADGDVGGSVEGSMDSVGKSLEVPVFRKQINPSIIKANKLLKFKCPHCLVVCLRRANLTRHLVCKHDYSQKKASISSKSLEKQLLRKKPAPQPSLASPTMVFNTPTLVPGQDDLQCSECPYLAKWPSDLRRHLQVHTMVKRFKCPICTNKYKYLGDLNVHMRRDHLMEPQQHTIAEDVVVSEVVKKSSPAVFRCPICAFATGSKADLEQHTRQHGDIEKTFQCRLCDYQTYWRGDVGRHLFRHHNIHLSKDGVELEKHFIFRSDIRPLTKMPMSLKTEQGVEMDNPAVMARLVPGNSSSPGKHSFKTVLNTQSQSGGKEGSMMCSFPSCEYRTTTPSKLEIHSAIHENIKIFVCPTCGKRANYKWDIVKHMVKVHKDPSATTNDVIMLPVDEARETITEYLARFEKKGMDTPTYGCSLCDFKSGEKVLVNKHQDEHHAGRNGHVLSFSVTTASVYIKQELMDQTEGESEGKVLTFVEPSPEELAKHDKPYACGNCKKAELSLPDIQRHYNYAHPYKEVRVIYTPDGTEFNCNTFEIYPQVKKSAAAAQNFLDAEDSGSMSAWQQTSPHSGKTIKPDSKYSNPKMHGYVKPFKCSVCGLRSNWKWDLKKHLRSKHPHDGGFVIMLSIEEAQMTYGKECSRSHPKCENQIIVSPDINTHIVNMSPSFDESFSNNDPLAVTSGRNKSGQVPCIGTSFDPGRRQWKCSGCDYITNWRRNMARHMTRRHSKEKNSLHVISLHMLSKDQQDAILEERKANLETMGKGASDLDEEEEGDGGDLDQSWSFSKPQSASGNDGRMWKCPKCSYHSTLRTHIILHMQKHELRPFLCGVCNAPFMNRSPLHSHIQKYHRRGDYIKLVKVNIRYDGVIDQSHLGISDQQHVFYCILCKMKFTDKSMVEEHLKSTHIIQEDMDDYIGMTMKCTTSTSTNTATNNNPYSAISNSKLFAVNGNHGSGAVLMDGSIIRRKLHHCKLCPYRTQKKSMLSFHMTYHIPTPANRYKCKYCPYYVSNTRLLHQHQRKWHLDSKKVDGAGGNAVSHPQPPSMLWEYPQATPPHSPYKKGNGETGTPRRHACEKCPYTTNCRNDFYYHKQFHRPKRTAEYKCEFCDYWVVHKRLLKQHMRLHEELSPAKSVYSDPGLVYDPVELTELAALKQNMISAKILPSLSRSPKISPMKIASRCSVDDKPGYVLKNGMYRKLHKCPKCPYTNTRARNMNLHVMMHGPRESSYPLMRCPYCDYYVGSKGLLSHHMKVHQKQYGDTPENDARRAALGLGDDDDDGDDSDDMVDIQAEQKVDTLLQISRMKRFGCEKCPYASAKRQHFERHLELHGSRQRYTCQYCDYSVPSSYLLTQHSRLHLMPNQNLLSCQSVNNLQHVGEVPADVALASALPPSDSDMSVTISVIHDHLGLYENSIYDPEQRKLYRCDRCPYANVRRDHLLSHLKFHMVSSSLVCPYCDYSAPKQALLSQHIRVHFCPLPELSDWLLENGQTERETSQRNIDMAEALKVAKEYQSQSKKKGKGKDGEKEKESGGDDGVKGDGKENIEDQPQAAPDTYICQYCDREFVTSDKCVKHELQHLIGNQFEMALKMLKTDKDKSGRALPKSKEVVSKSVEPVPKPVEPAPKSEEVVIKSEEIVFKSAETVPRSEEAVPETAETASKSEEVVIKSEETASKSEDAVLETAETASKSEEVVIKSEETAPKCVEVVPLKPNTACKMVDGKDSGGTKGSVGGLPGKDGECDGTMAQDVDMEEEEEETNRDGGTQTVVGAVEGNPGNTSTALDEEMSGNVEKEDEKTADDNEEGNKGKQETGSINDGGGDDDDISGGKGVAVEGKEENDEIVSQNMSCDDDETNKEGGKEEVGKEDKNSADVGEEGMEIDGGGESDSMVVDGCGESDMKGVDESDAKGVDVSCESDTKSVDGCDESDTKSVDGCDESDMKGVDESDEKDVDGGCESDMKGVDESDAKDVDGGCESDTKSVNVCGESDMKGVDEKGVDGGCESDKKGVDGSGESDAKGVDESDAKGVDESDAKGVDGSGESDTKSVDGSGESDTKGIDGSGESDAKGVDENDTKGVDGSGESDMKGVDRCGESDTKVVDGSGESDMGVDVGGESDTKVVDGSGENDTKGVDGSGESDMKGVVSECDGGKGEDGVIGGDDCDDTMTDDVILDDKEIEELLKDDGDDDVKGGDKLDISKDVGCDIVGDNEKEIVKDSQPETKNSDDCENETKMSQVESNETTEGGSDDKDVEMLESVGNETLGSEGVENETKMLESVENETKRSESVENETKISEKSEGGENETKMSKKLESCENETKMSEKSEGGENETKMSEKSESCENETKTSEKSEGSENETKTSEKSEGGENEAKMSEKSESGENETKTSGSVENETKKLEGGENETKISENV